MISGVTCTALGHKKRQQLPSVGKCASLFLASHESWPRFKYDTLGSAVRPFVFHSHQGELPGEPMRLFPGIPEASMKCSVLQGETVTSPSLGETHRPCSASPSGMWCLCSQLRVFFFFLLQIFYPFKANSLSSGWGVLSREASEKAELVHQALSPLSRRSGLSGEQGWPLLADERTDVTLVAGESRCVPQKSSSKS